MTAHAHHSAIGAVVFLLLWLLFVGALVMSAECRTRRAKRALATETGARSAVCDRTDALLAECQSTALRHDLISAARDVSEWRRYADLSTPPARIIDVTTEA